MRGTTRTHVYAGTGGSAHTCTVVRACTWFDTGRRAGAQACLATRVGAATRVGGTTHLDAPAAADQARQNCRRQQHWGNCDTLSYRHVPISNKFV